MKSIRRKIWKLANYSSDQKYESSHSIARHSNQSQQHLTDYSEEKMYGQQSLESNLINLKEAPGVKEVLLSWNIIEKWTEKNHPDLHSSLSKPCSPEELRIAANDLEITFPPDVIQYFLCHDGQRISSGLTGSDPQQGLMFGLELMSLDAIVGMTKTWRSVNERVNAVLVQKKMNQSSSDLSQPDKLYQTHRNKSMDYFIQQERISRPKIPSASSPIPEQHSVPADCIQKCYFHPMWIPMITDSAGNHVAVDMAPAKHGVEGQVILVGRDFDTKYVVAPNWGEFMLMFLKDLNSRSWHINYTDSNDSGELVYYDRERGQELEYFDVLVSRVVKA